MPEDVSYIAGYTAENFNLAVLHALSFQGVYLMYLRIIVYVILIGFILRPSFSLYAVGLPLFSEYAVKSLLYIIKGITVIVS